MKKIIAILAGALFALCGLTACGGDTPPAAVSVSVAEEGVTIPAGSFDPADYHLRVRYADGSEETVPMTAAMLAESEVAKLAQPGSYTLTVTYLGCTALFPVTVTEGAGREEVNVVLFWEEGTKTLRIAVIGPLEDYERADFAGFEMEISYRGSYEGVAARLEGLKVKSEATSVTLYWAAAENLGRATEVARLAFSENAFSEESVSVRVYDEAQRELSCGVYYGNDYFGEAEV